MRCAFRLLGLCQNEVKLAAALDRRLGLVAKVYAVVEDRACRKILLMGCDDDPEDHPAPGGPDDEAEAPLPFDLAEVNRQLRTIAEEECARIRPLLARHEDEERDNRDDLPRRVSFDDSAEGERVHRYQTHWSRMLLRTLAELRNHRAPGARGSPRTDRGGCPPVPVRRPARSPTRGRGPVILRILAPAGPRDPASGRGSGSPASGRGDAAKQTHRGRVNVRTNKELRRIRW